MLYQLSYSRNNLKIQQSIPYIAIEIWNLVSGGESRIRTYEDISQQSYSLPQLATLVSPQTISIFLELFECLLIIFIS